MSITLKLYDKQLSGQICLNSSKSESNRVLLMNALSTGLELKNLSSARDTTTMTRLLTQDPEEWDVLDAGTTMRFCTAYLAIRGREQVITGSSRMKERPIGLLVDALRRLGAQITYMEKEEYPPLRITGITDQPEMDVSIPGNISSQYISALLMIAPVLPLGLNLTLTGEVYSRPYIEMTLQLMQHFGIASTWEDRTITIAPQSYKANSYTVESDWSGASYWFSMAALNQKPELRLTGLKKNSFQGDQAIVKMIDRMGVKTSYTSEGVLLSSSHAYDQQIDLDFRKCPDLAQTVMVTAAVKGITLRMTGLETLRIKETDRIRAMQDELSKLGANLHENDGEWILTPGILPNKIAPIRTYKDHRMAMAFAPVCMKAPVTIEEPDVVQKSYPGFWDDLKSVGVEVDLKL